MHADDRGATPTPDDDSGWLADTTRATWSALCPDAASALVEQIGDAVARDHAEPHRRWHTAFHVRDMHGYLGELTQAADVSDRTVLLAELACLYHDRVYRPGAPDNERASARLAREDGVTLGLPARDADMVVTLIEATEHHDPGRVEGVDEATRGLVALLCDADMAILGAPPERYARYRQAVREEYAVFTDEQWAAGRAAFLRGTLAAPRIFHTEEAHARWDAAARRNLEEELRLLTGT